MKPIMSIDHMSSVRVACSVKDSEILVVFTVDLCVSEIRVNSHLKKKKFAAIAAVSGNSYLTYYAECSKK